MKKKENKYEIIDISEGNIVKAELSEQDVIDYANTCFHYEIKDNECEIISNFADAKKILKLENEWEVIKTRAKKRNFGSIQL